MHCVRRTSIEQDELVLEDINEVNEETSPNEQISEETKTTPKNESNHDLWETPAFELHIVVWSKMSTKEKFVHIFWDYLGKTILLLACFYLFVCSLSFISSSFQLIGGKAASEVLKETSVFSNPVAGLMIGLLITALIQSSSTSSSIIVSLVGSGILGVQEAIPIIMGTNIGTTITNNIVALGQINKRSRFRRAFAGATVHDIFNILTAIILLIVEVISGYMYHLSGAILGGIDTREYNGTRTDFLKALTNPLTNLIVQVDDELILEVARKNIQLSNITTLMKMCCQWNVTLETNAHVCTEDCQFLFRGLGGQWHDGAIGSLILVTALFFMCLCLFCMIRLLHSLLKRRIAQVLKKYINAEFPGRLSYFTGYVAILIGMGMTILMQSSSIFTSSLIPIAGVGVLKLDRMYPLSLGSNIGTTTTAIMTALAQPNNEIQNALRIALCHLIFNMTGIILFYPFPFSRIPIKVAKFLGREAGRYRWFSLAYIFVVFFIFPAIVFGLSVAGWYVLLAVLGPIVIVVICVMIVNLLQSKCPTYLPKVLKDWSFVPLYCRSLDPCDKTCMSLFHCFTCLKGQKDGEEKSKPTAKY